VTKVNTEYDDIVNQAKVNYLKLFPKKLFPWQQRNYFHGNKETISLATTIVSLAKKDISMATKVLFTLQQKLFPWQQKKLFQKNYFHDKITISKKTISMAKPTPSSNSSPANSTTHIIRIRINKIIFNKDLEYL
jgi:hypothetical protein